MVTPALVAFIIPFASLHFPHDGQNQRNPGLAAEFAHASLPDSVTFAAGAYQNSHDRRTVFGQAVWTPLRTKMVQAGLSAGLGTGYKSPVIGGAFVRVTPFGAEHIGLHLTLIPPTSAEQKGVVGFAIYIPVE